MKVLLGKNVLLAAEERLQWVFDSHEKICISFSGGKDSTVLLHLTLIEAKKRNRKVGLLFLDWEAQYQLTIDFVKKMFELYSDWIEPYWITLPISTVNATSQFEPEWTCWDPEKKDLWVRDLPKESISDILFFPFYQSKMTFEEFMPSFSKWFSQEKTTAILIGLRTQESINRLRTMTLQQNHRSEGKNYTIKRNTYTNVYPLYDWKVDDIWTFHAQTDLPYNQLYDRFYQAGLSPFQMRICEPYGSDSQRGLHLFQVIEPETWTKVAARVSGARTGAIYTKGWQNNIQPPSEKTWKEMTYFLLDSIPVKISDHYKNKFAVYMRWYKTRGYPEGLPDTQEGDVGSKDDCPSWRRLCRALLKNDYWCMSLSFSPTKSENLEKYENTLRERRESWKLI